VEAVKKWDGERSLRGGVREGLPSVGVRGNTGNFFLKYRCKSVRFGAFWGHQVMKSGMENRSAWWVFSVFRTMSGQLFLQYFDAAVLVFSHV